MVKKRGLGKSLDALLAYTAPEGSSAKVTAAEETSTDETLTRLSLEKIQPGKYQPRREMDQEALEDLASSIRTQGIIQPLIVRSIGPEKYEIIAGERRSRAAKLAGLDSVPVIIRQIPDEAAIAIALIENIQRENLNPIEEAMALHRLIEEFEMTHQAVAEAVGKSRASVSNLLRLLALPDTIKSLLEARTIEMGHARALITLPEALQLEAANAIVERGMSVRDTETLVRRMQEPAAEKPAKRTLDPNLARLQDNLSKQLSMKVAIQCNARGRGKLTIHYRNLEELDGLLAQLDATEA